MQLPTLSSQEIQLMTPQEASVVFLQHVREIELSGFSYNDALVAARTRFAELWARIKSGDGSAAGKNHQAVAIGNELIPPAPVASPGLSIMLGLPASATQSEFVIAWNACKGKLSPRDSKAIWKALLTFQEGGFSATEEGRRSATYAEMSALKAARERYPALAAEVGA